jgi:Ser/Thr protein kinase RdoA (MazF antagonist)
LIKGYKSKRDINLELLDFFMLLRALTYVGWNISRMNDKGGQARNARFINTALELAKHLKNIN